VSRRFAWQGVVGFACLLLACGCSGSRDRGAGSRDAGGPVRLVPDPSFSGARITVVFADRNVRREQCRFEWRRNGAPIPGSSGDALEPRWFSRGDRIEVVVVVPGAGGGPERRIQAGVDVVNSPPIVMRVAVRPVLSSGRAELTAVPEAVDADGDSLTYAYRWFRNGQPFAPAAGAILPMKGLAVSDRIAVEVVASDGQSTSPPLRSDAASVDNQTPEFISDPATPTPADSVFQYQAVASDPDGDPLRYELVEGPPGMTMTPEGGVTWRLPTGADRSGEYSVGLRALDPKGAAATQRFSIRLGTSPAGR
jgi:hypothetical protein